MLFLKLSLVVVQIAMEQEPPPDAESKDTFLVESVHITQNMQRMSVQEIVRISYSSLRHITDEVSHDSFLRWIDLASRQEYISMC